MTVTIARPTQHQPRQDMTDAQQLDALRIVVATARAAGATVVRLDAITALIGPGQAAARAQLQIARQDGWWR